MKPLAATLIATLLPLAAAAQTTGVLATKRPITWGMIFSLLFLMLGPIKLLGTFAAATKDCDRVFRFRLATRAFLFSIAAVTIAAGFGARILDNFAIPLHCCRSPPE
jgi:multiple antibiotic resistance protein